MVIKRYNFSFLFPNFGPRWCPWDFGLYYHPVVTAFCSSVFSILPLAHRNLLPTPIRDAYGRPGWADSQASLSLHHLLFYSDQHGNKEERVPLLLPGKSAIPFQLRFSYSILLAVRFYHNLDSSFTANIFPLWVALEKLKNDESLCTIPSGLELVQR